MLQRIADEHPDTLTSMNNLASTYRNQGRWDAAEELDMQVMETSKKKLGADFCLVRESKVWETRLITKIIANFLVWKFY